MMYFIIMFFLGEVVVIMWIKDDIEVELKKL